MNKQNLHTIFSNSECLSEKKLLAYCSNKLSNKERNEVEQHTLNCKFCSDALEGFEKKIHSENGYYSTKAEVLKKQKRNKYFIISIAGIAAACLAFALLINKLDTSQTRQAENIKQTENSLKQKSETRESKPGLKMANPSKNSGKTNTANKQKTIKNSESVSSNNNSKLDKSILQEKVGEDVLFMNEEEGVSYNISIEENENHLNRSNKKTNTSSFAKSNDDEAELNIPNVAPNKYFVEDEISEADKKEIKTGVISSQDSFNYEPKSLSLDKDILTSRKLEESKESIRFKNSKNKLLETKNNRSFHVDSTTQQKQFNLGIFNFKTENYKLAIKSLETITKENTHYFDAQLHIGKAYKKLGENEKAKSYLNNALKGDKPIRTEALKVLKAIK